jgi:hypothetical protein
MRSSFTLVVILLLFLFSDIKSQSDCYNDIEDAEIANLVENSIFVHPNKPNIIINANNNGLIGVDVLISTDWGESWTFAHNTGGWVDPSVAIDLYGRYYVTHITNQ